MPRLTSLSRSVAGRVAVVTGAASGMGRATAFLLADEGATVAATDLHRPAEVVDDIRAAGGEAEGWALDVADPQAVVDVVAAIAGSLGRIDILVNNAGVSTPAPIGDEGWEAAWARTLAVNLSGEARMIRACLPHLQAHGEGRVVNIASTEGLGATAGMSPYTASKHGVIGLTKSMAVELGATGVTVNCVCPGPIHTGMTEPIPDDAKERYARRRVPLRRYGEAEEVAHMTVSLCLPAASYCNGAVLVVDGGMLAQNT
ncbi:SDR family oxidoreductase [Acidiferrimicrobium sp. IK]|uniref:SDR family NAD(P)-dependent oxidoreductase n=1 Tax=Acidiferrimicrobium sp. IK TaxID=2871700 RepID=UPI0021CB2762|nr:SDR family NAD(P)-dependent oxidoreductase [Acidiferrimicrobium sp. IK]MCU4187012.1 SDR family oxidoreductase [Acidiferrimicrobium sp. IK]